MRIAMMTNNYKPFVGGVPISIERLADSLRDLGHWYTSLPRIINLRWMMMNIRFAFQQ